jgi:tetratricopeptide (TPR) repeat protein
LAYYEKAKEQYMLAVADDPNDYGLLNTFGVMWNKLGNYAKAIEYYEKAVAVLKEKYGEDCKELATQYNNLAMANTNLGQELQAISWLEKALLVDEKVYGTNHAFVAQDYHSLGMMWKKQNEFDKSLDCLQKSLNINIAVSTYFPSCSCCCCFLFLLPGLTQWGK